jgi:two-component system, OmpR family, sensor kinase
MSLRLRLAVFIGVLIALAVLAQGVVGYKRFERLGLLEVDQVLLNYFDEISHRSTMGPKGGRFGGRSDNNQSAPPPMMFRNLETRNRLLRVRLLRNDIPVATFGDAFPDQIQIPKNSMLTIGQWRAASRDLGESLRVEAVINLEDQQRGVRNYLQSLFLTVPLFSLLGAFAAWLFSAAALQPLENLIGATQHVADSGDLTQRVPHRQGPGELERLTRTFNQMLERLQGFREREIGFTRTAAHEFRTPLTAMRAQLDAQREGWATADEALDTARDQVERMTKLSQALLVLAREGRAELSSIDLGNLAQTIAKSRGATYNGLDSMMVQGNQILLERALENLLENAIKHAPNSEITVKLEKAASKVLLSVTDLGAGIKPAALERASEAFYRAPGTKAYGSGLGLAVVENILKAHGGRLLLENVVPHGLKVTLELLGS